MAEQPITAHFALKRLYTELNGHATEITEDLLNGCIASKTVMQRRLRMVPVDERKLAGILKLPFKKNFSLRRWTNGFFFTNELERNIAVHCSVFSRSCPGSEKSNFACR